MMRNRSDQVTTLLQPPRNAHPTPPPARPTPPTPPYATHAPGPPATSTTSSTFTPVPTATPTQRRVSHGPLSSSLDASLRVGRVLRSDAYEAAAAKSGSVTPALASEPPPLRRARLQREAWAREDAAAVRRGVPDLIPPCFDPLAVVRSGSMVALRRKVRKDGRLEEALHARRIARALRKGGGGQGEAGVEGRRKGREERTERRDASGSGSSEMGRARNAVTQQFVDTRKHAQERDRAAVRFVSLAKKAKEAARKAGLDLDPDVDLDKILAIDITFAADDNDDNDNDNDTSSPGPRALSSSPDGAVFTPSTTRTGRRNRPASQRKVPPVALPVSMIRMDDEDQDVVFAPPQPVVVMDDKRRMRSPRTRSSSRAGSSSRTRSSSRARSSSRPRPGPGTARRSSWAPAHPMSPRQDHPSEESNAASAAAAAAAAAEKRAAGKEEEVLDAVMRKPVVDRNKLDSPLHVQDEAYRVSKAVLVGSKPRVLLSPAPASEVRVSVDSKRRNEVALHAVRVSGGGGRSRGRDRGSGSGGRPGWHIVDDVVLEMDDGGEGPKFML